MGTAPVGDGTLASGGKRVLLIGGAGYIGLPVAQALLAAGRPVRILDRLVYNHGAATLALPSSAPAQFIYGDMGDERSLDRALDGIADVVILAGLVGDPITRKFPEQSRAINEIALRRCLDRLAGRGLGRVVFVSTCSNYGLIGESEFADENFPLKPLSLYAEA